MFPNASKVYQKTNGSKCWHSPHYLGESKCYLASRKQCLICKNDLEIPVSSKKTEINARLRDICFLSGFYPNEHNCTTFGIFALHGFWSQNYEHIFPGNKRKYQRKNVNTRPSRHEWTFFVKANIKSQNERISKKNCEQKKVLIEDPGVESITVIPRDIPKKRKTSTEYPQN